MDRRQFIKGSAMLGFTASACANVGKDSGLISGKDVRTIHRIVNSSRTKVGTLPIIRAFAGDHEDYVSPFVLFDEFGPVNVDPGADPLRVDAHPHAGVVPTTYFLEGTGHHKDSLNYDFQIGKGDFMMFSSGRGAIHMEESGQKLYDEGGAYHGFQIWLNMPAKHKFIDPTTHVHGTEKQGFVENDHFEINVILGEAFDVKSSIQTLTPTFYYHIKLKKNGRLTLPTNPNHNAFLYNIKGLVEVEDGKSVHEYQLVLYERGASNIELYSKEGAEFLILGGQPLNEVVYAYGPFVMNSREQIELCYRNYHAGKMGDPDLVN